MLSFLLFVMPLAAVLAFGGLAIRDYYRAAERNLAALLGAEATRLLGREVRVGRAVVEGGHAYLDDVRIAEGRTLARSGTMARARRIVLDFDLLRILLERRQDVPLFALVRVLDPVVHVARDRAGRWNFADLFKPRPGPPGRPAVGRVEVLNGALNYEDAALPRHPRQTAPLFRARMTGVNGHLLFHPDRSVSWSAAGQGATGQVQTASVLGTYEPDDQRLFLRIQADRAALPALANRFLLPDVRLLSGFASGQATILHQPGMRGDIPFDLQVDVIVEEGAFASHRLAEPVRGLRGTVSLSNAAAAVHVDADFAGSDFHAEGTVLGLRDPLLNGWVSGTGVQLQRALTALNLRDRYPALRQLEVAADVRANVSGSLDDLSIRASGPLQAQGRVQNGPSLPETGRLQIALGGSLKAPRLFVSGALPRIRFQDVEARNVRLQAALDGPLDAPRLLVKATLPQARYQQYEARDLSLSGAYTPARASADFAGGVASGRVAGRVTLVPDGRRSRYALTLRARNVNLARVPLSPPAGEVGRESRGARVESREKAAPAFASDPRTPGHRLQGTLHADLIAQGRFDQKIPKVTAEVQVSGLKHGDWTAQKARAHLRTVGDVLHVEPAIVRDVKGFVVVHGQADLRKKSLHLHAEADEVDLARLPNFGFLTSDVRSKGRPPTNENPEPKIENALSGFVYLRDGRITGTWDDPRFSGTLYGYGLAASESARLDYAEAKIEASREALRVEEGQAWRFPGSVTVRGVVRRPLADDAQIDLSGRFTDVGLFDLADLAGSAVSLTGTASGEFQVRGALQSPQMVADGITVERASIGYYLFHAMTASLRYDPTAEEGTWILSDVRATLEGAASGQERATITGSARLTGSRRFTIEAQADEVDLNLLEPYIAEYATLEGIGRATVSLSGVWRDGKAQNLTGTLTAQTTGFTINGEALGDLHGGEVGQPAVLTVQGQMVTSDGFSFGNQAGGVDFTALRYDLDSQALEADATMRGVRIESVKTVLTSSPHVVSNPESPVAKWLKPVTDPFSGTIYCDSIQIRGTPDDPNVRLAWRSDDMIIGPQKVDLFTGVLAFNRNVTTLESAQLRAEETVIAASGTLVANQSLSGEVEMHNLPVEVLKRWFPGRPQLEGLTGMVDFVSVSASGSPAAPVLTASAEVGNLEWRDVSGEILGGRVVRAERVSVAQATVGDGAIHVEDVRIALSDPAPAIAPQIPATQTLASEPPPAGGTALRRYEARASGSVEFSWEPPFIPENPKLNLEVRIGGKREQDPGEDLGLLNAFLPGPKAQLEGKIKALFTWTGTVRQPKVLGTLAIKQEPHERLRFANMTTVFTGLDAGFTFTGDQIRVDRFTARSAVINPRSGQVVATGEPIEMTGALSLDENAADKPSIRLTVPRLLFAESPLPFLGSGRAVGEVRSQDLTIGGTLGKPVVSGTLYVRQADFRVPDAFEPRGENLFVLPFRPSFHVRLVVQDSVRIGAAQMVAYVRTESGRPIELSGDLEAPRISGRLLVERGTLAFPTARFTIQRGGEIALLYPSYEAGSLSEPGLGVLVNLTATTRLTAESVNGIRKRYTITVEARGPLNSEAPLQITDPEAVGAGPITQRSLRLAFRSDPPDLALSAAGLQRRITGLLGGEAAIASLFQDSRGLGQALEAQISDVISASILPELFERTGIGEALGFEELTIESSRLDVFTLRVSRNLLGPLYLSYWQLLTGDDPANRSGRWEFKLSYRLPLSRRALFEFAQFSWTLNEQRTNAYLLEGVFRF